ncbi:MAG: hypothetical protein ACEQSR_04300 [Candidatus Methylacidiphilales bacterium]
MKRIETLKNYILDNIEEENYIEKENVIIIQANTIFDDTHNLKYSTYDNKLISNYLSELNDVWFQKVCWFRHSDLGKNKNCDYFNKKHGNLNLIIIYSSSEIYKLYLSKRRQEKLDIVMKLIA